MTQLQQSTPTCPFCGQLGKFCIAEPDRYLGLRPELTHPYYLCPRCDHLFQPVIESELLLSFYPSSLSYYDVRPAGVRAVVARWRHRNRARSVEWRATKGQILEIGCGAGQVLDELRKRGWRVSGMDWNAANARAVAERLKIDVAAGPEGLLSIPSESMDVICMFHVLEHEQRPMEFLAEVKRILKPGGRLVVGVPNWDSTLRRLFQRQWAGYDFSRHRQVFTPRSLDAALVAAGFRMERLTGRLEDELMDLHGSTRLWLRSVEHLNPLFVALTMLAGMPLVAASHLFGRYSVMYAYARKR